MTRSTGKTQRMIDELVQAVAEGKPNCRVVAHNIRFALYQLRPRILEALAKAGIASDSLGSCEIIAGGSTIDFCSVGELQRKRRGVTGITEFWDHAAFLSEEYRLHGEELYRQSKARREKRS